MEELKIEIDELKQRINEMDQYHRKQDIIISGLEEKEQETEEDLLETIQEVAKSLGVPLEPYDVNAFHRLAPNKNKKKSSNSTLE